VLKNNFYVYIYFDPRKNKKYKYDKYEFDYEPFYVGRGRNKRFLDHLVYLDGTMKSKKIQKIVSLGLTPIIIKVKENLFLKEANDLEIDLIKNIGRRKVQNGLVGPLTNLTPGGDGGDTFSGRKHSEKTKQKMSLSQKGKIVLESTKKLISEKRKNKTYEQIYGKEKGDKLRKQHSQAMLGNRNFGDITGRESSRKGKTYEEFYGEEKAKQLKDLYSKERSGKNNSSYGRKGILSNVYGQKRTPEQIKNMRIAQQKRRQKKVAETTNLSI
jgi:hypothetical protein